MRFKILIKIGQTLNFIHLEIFIVSFEKICMETHMPKHVLHVYKNAHVFFYFTY